MNKAKGMTIIKKTGLTIAFPLAMFIVMMIITAAAGKANLYASSTMVMQVMRDASLTTIIAMAIYLQFKNGRFDFSGGATMILTGLIAALIARDAGNSAWLMLVLCIVIGVVFSVFTASAYVASRVPIIICTIAVTLLYESLTYVINNGAGISIISTTSLAIFGTAPYIFIPLLIAVALFIFYSYFTTEGRRSKLLAGNQKIASNIGINETKSIYVTYIVTGVLLGLGALIYTSQNTIAAQSNLSTSSILFSYIVPVFIGMFLGSASIDAIGIVVAAVGMEFMNYGLDCLGVGSGGWQQIIFGMFMLGFYAFSAKSAELKAFFERLILKTKKEKSNA